MRVSGHGWGTPEAAACHAKPSSSAPNTACSSLGGRRTTFAAAQEGGHARASDPLPWTDQKIRVHVFYCVLALAVAHLLRRQAAQAGLHLSVRELLATLAGIQETVLLYQGQRGRPRARHVLTEMDPTQQRLYDLFGLDAYAPRR
jgi:hypothetical protein